MLHAKDSCRKYGVANDGASDDGRTPTKEPILQGAHDSRRDHKEKQWGSQYRKRKAIAAEAK